MKKKFLVIGHARHGKDTVAAILATELGLVATSSSEYACQHLVYPQLKVQYGYKTPCECFKDRANHRVEWYNIIANYNINDTAKMAREVFATSDIYIGMRSAIELQATLREGLVDLVIWVDAGQRVPVESRGSCTVEKNMAHVIIDNNGTMLQLEEKVAQLAMDLREKNQVTNEAAKVTIIST